MTGNEDFKTVTKFHYRRPPDKSTHEFLGVQCPACQHQFMPPTSGSAPCPKCGYTYKPEEPRS